MRWHFLCRLRLSSAFFLFLGKTAWFVLLLNIISSGFYFHFFSIRHFGKCLWSTISGNCKVTRSNTWYHADIGQSPEQSGHCHRSGKTWQCGGQVCTNACSHIHYVFVDTQGVTAASWEKHQEKCECVLAFGTIGHSAPTRLLATSCKLCSLLFHFGSIQCAREITQWLLKAFAAASRIKIKLLSL